MAEKKPRLDRLDPEKIAELASERIREASKPHLGSEEAAAAFTEVIAHASMGIFYELHRLRIAVEKMEASD